MEMNKLTLIDIKEQTKGLIEALDGIGESIQNNLASMSEPEQLRIPLGQLARAKAMWEQFDKRRKEIEKEQYKPIQQLIKQQLDKVEMLGDKIKERFLEIYAFSPAIKEMVDANTGEVDSKITLTDNKGKGIFKVSPAKVSQGIAYDKISYQTHPEFFDMVPTLNREKVLEFTRKHGIPAD